MGFRANLNVSAARASDGMYGNQEEELYVSIVLYLVCENKNQQSRLIDSMQQILLPNFCGWPSEI